MGTEGLRLVPDNETFETGRYDRFREGFGDAGPAVFTTASALEDALRDVPDPEPSDVIRAQMEKRKVDLTCVVMTAPDEMYVYNSADDANRWRRQLRLEKATRILMETYHDF